MFKATLNGKEFLLSEKTKVIDLMEPKDLDIVACIVNNKVRRLDYQVHYDCDIKLISYKTGEGSRVYFNSLRYLFDMACHNLYPDLEIKFSYSVSRAILVKIINNTIRFNEQMKKEIEAEMRRLVKAKLPIEVVKKTTDECVEFFTKLGYKDKVDILKYRPEKTLHISKCGDYMNYVYGLVVINTECLDKFALNIYEKGILLRYPRSEFDGQIPQFKKEDTYQKTLNTAFKWAKMINAESVAQINSHITDEYNKVNFVHVCEARHNADLVELADKISSDSNIRLIEIAGPSSSGKTTFSNRLRIQLMTKGITPVKISIDDYYIDRDLIPKDKDGKYDLESINIIDIPLFNQHLTDLINGKEVTMPSFNFAKGKREVGRTIKIEKDQPIIIEGIHALNDELTSSINRKNKFKIYIAPHVQVNVDNLSPIRSTDLRLLRRIVRDNAYRGYKAEQTISIWDSVRNGEFKWIYANQEDVDFVFNSDLVYEVNVMKKHALPLLNEIPEDSPYYRDAVSLIKFLKYYKDIEDELVPCNSLLREFIGGSCFKDV